MMSKGQFRFRMILSSALLLLVCGSSALMAAAPGNLDDLLEQTRSARTREQQANDEREKKFLAERNKQSELLTAAKAALAVERQRGATLQSTYENEKKLTELQTQVEQKAGNLGEMFGVVRQVANDFSSVVHNSMISAEYPDREDFVAKLAGAKTLPSMSDLERFWFELQREMTESGHIARFKSKVVTADGKPLDTTVVRVGSFNASVQSQYAQYLPAQKQLAIMARQPGTEFQSAAKRLEEASEGYVSSVVDPTVACCSPSTHSARMSSSASSAANRSAT